MKRKALQYLIDWKKASLRKPLLIFGARQVGKTWLMKYFGEKEYENYVYLNFEKEKTLKNLFQQDYNCKRIVDALKIFSGQTITTGKTLIIFDEIQEAAGGLTALKYFNEDLPELHVIAAGSLLGVSMKQKASFPVGQVNFMTLQPLSFSEFLEAKGLNELNALLEQKDHEMMRTFREKFIFNLKQYYFIGGMPEAVSHFIQHEDYSSVREIQKNILSAYQKDFSKYAPAEIITKIRLIFDTIVSQLSKENKKFVYGLLKEGARAKEFENALMWLEEYGVVHKVYRNQKPARPLSAYKDLKSFKLYMNDVGLLGALANLSPKTLLEKDALFQEFKGALTEQYVFQELIVNKAENIHYWTNNKGSAEVDFIFSTEEKICPLEVKANENLYSKSLKSFHQKHPQIHCYRTSLSDYREEEWMTNVPLYAIAEEVR